MKTNKARLLYTRIDRTRRLLARQIKAECIPYRTLSDQEAIDLFIKHQMMTYKSYLGFHEAFVLLGDETEADRPLMPPLLRKALQVESAIYSKVAYAELLYLTVLENDSLKKELQQAEGEAKVVEAKLADKLALIDRIAPTHALRMN